MKRPTWRIMLINRRDTAGNAGSVTLETALAMPVFLLLAFFLIFLVQTSIAAMALHGALSQTVRLAASSWYPISLMQDKPQSTSGTDDANGQSRRSGARETVGEFGKWLPAPLRDWAQAFADGEWSPESEAAKVTLGQLALQLADSKALAADRFRVTTVGLPKNGNAAESYLTLEAEYRLPFRVPFSGKPLLIRASARERVWVGGTASRAIAAEPDGGELNVQFVSLEPNPVRPGRKATLVLQTAPGTTLDLSVIYKSGQSQAKHLGVAVADETGRVTWTWHVSGNTTSGTWNWVVHGEGGASYAQPFQVERKTS